MDPKELYTFSEKYFRKFHLDKIIFIPSCMFELFIYIKTITSNVYYICTQ